MAKKKSAKKTGKRTGKKVRSKPKKSLPKAVKTDFQKIEEERRAIEKQKRRSLNFKNLSLAHGLMAGLQAAWMIPTIIVWPIMIQNIYETSIILTTLVMIFIIILLGSIALVAVTAIYFVYEKIMRTKIKPGQILTLAILILMTILSYSFFLNHLLARI